MLRKTILSGCQGDVTSSQLEIDWSGQWLQFMTMSHHAGTIPAEVVATKNGNFNPKCDVFWTRANWFSLGNVCKTTSAVHKNQRCLSWTTPVTSVYAKEDMFTFRCQSPLLAVRIIIPLHLRHKEWVGHHFRVTKRRQASTWENAVTVFPAVNQRWPLWPQQWPISYSPARMFPRPWPSILCLNKIKPWPQQRQIRMFYFLQSLLQDTDKSHWPKVIRSKDSCRSYLGESF